MVFLTICCWLLIFTPFQLVLAKKKSFSKLKVPLEELTPAKVNKTLIERGLINPKIAEVNAKDIVENHNQIYRNKSSSFPGEIIGFVTPWNKEGNQIAKRFRHKINVIVPCWYNVTFRSSGVTLKSEGVEKKWLKAWTKTSKKQVASKKTKIFPRFYLHDWTLENFERFINDDKQIESLVSKIKKECEDYHYDGVLFDFGPVAYEAMGKTAGEKKNLRRLHQKTQTIANRTGVLLRMLGEELARGNLTLRITVAPPTNFYNVFPVIHPIIIQRALSAKWVSDIVVMTYDYGGHKSGSSIAPLNWAIGCCQYFQEPSDEAPPEFGITRVAENRISMAVNFYGTDNADITYDRDLAGRDYIKILKEYQTTFKWDEKTKEHMVEYYDAVDDEFRHVYYPTLLSLYHRVEAVRERGYGLAIWDLGQGLEYFMDMF